MVSRFALSLFCVGAFLNANAAQNSAPNFLFILVDDQGWSGTSVAMTPGKDFSRSERFRMPNLDRLAARGMVFSQAYAAHPKCECSRAAIQMGRTTTSLNAVDKRARNWSAAATDSLANTLKRANPAYRAAHFGKWQWETPPETFGYDASDGVTQNIDGDSSDPEDPKQSFGIARRAQAFLEKQVREGHPFYLQLSYYAVHNKPQALAATLRKYENTGGGGRNGGGGGGRDDRALMAAMTEDLDTCIGSVLTKLLDLGVLKNTYVIYTSDNGMASEALRGDKTSLDEGGLRVPLLVAGPGIRGGFCSEPVVSYDLFPTVLDFVAPHFTLPRGIEGGSWKSLLLSSGKGSVRRPIDRMVFHIDTEVDHPQTAIRKGNLKLLHFWDTKEDFLYDLATDLGERRNLALSRPEVAARLWKELQAHVRAGLGELAYAVLEKGETPQRDRPPGGVAGKEKGRKKNP